MNMDWLPSKTVIAFVLIPLCTIFAMWLVAQIQAKYASTKAQQELAFSKTLDSAVNAYNNRDTDGDLLKDWEEFLHGTDINKQDTDGDGLDDYSEVLDPIRDPLVADADRGRTQAQSNPGDDVIGGGPYYVYDDSLNTTEKFSRDVLNTFVQLQGSGSLNTNVQDQLFKKVNENVDAREEKTGAYTEEDITVASSNNPQAVAGYRAGFVNATQALQNVQNHDLILLAQFSETSNTDLLDELSSNAEAYKQLIADLRTVPVPPEVVPAHLEMLNNTHIVQENIRDMSQAEEDPLGALMAAGDYATDEEVLGKNLEALSLYFQNN